MRDFVSGGNVEFVRDLEGLEMRGDLLAEGEVGGGTH